MISNNTELVDSIINCYVQKKAEDQRHAKSEQENTVLKDPLKNTCKERAVNGEWREIFQGNSACE